MHGRSIDVVVAGHICLDVIPQIRTKKSGLQDFLVPGKLVAIGPSVTSTGGAVSNTGLALHRLGLATRLMGKVGDDMFGGVILEILRGYSAETAKGMIVAQGEHSSYTIVISPPGIDRVFLHCTGANDTFVADDLRLDEIRDAALFHFGYPPLMKEMYQNDGAQLKEIFSRVKALNVTTSLDMASPDPDSEAGRADWRRILQNTLPHVDVFLPSLEELLYMLDRETYRRMEQKHGAADLLHHTDGELLSGLSAELLAMGAAIVGIKLGEHGLYVRTTGDKERLRQIGPCAPADAGEWLGREWIAPCFRVEVTGTTGAGDCTIAGFLAGMVKGDLPLAEIVTSAVAVGACNVEKPDAVSGIPAWSVVRQRIAAGWPRRACGLELKGWVYNQDAGLYIGPHDRMR